jgi:hypothetical protein
VWEFHLLAKESQSDYLLANFKPVDQHLDFVVNIEFWFLHEIHYRLLFVPVLGSIDAYFYMQQQKDCLLTYVVKSGAFSHGHILLFHDSLVFSSSF